MSQNQERDGFAEALHDAAAAFEVPDAASLHGAAVRRGRQIRRRRAGARVVGGTAALCTAGVLAFALPGAAGNAHGAHGAADAASGGASARPTTAAGPAYTHPTAPPPIRAGRLTEAVVVDAIEYALPAEAQVIQTGGPLPGTNIELIDENTHSWYVQTTVTLKGGGQFGTLVAVSVSRSGSDTCSALNNGWAEGKGSCTQSVLDGGKLLYDAVPYGVDSSGGVSDYLEWFSPAGYEVDLQVESSAGADDLALTKAQLKSLIAHEVFGKIAAVLPPQACPGGTFSKPVDPPKPGDSPLQHVRCSSDGKLYPTY